MTNNFLFTALQLCLWSAIQLLSCVVSSSYPIGYAVPLREAAYSDGAVCLDGSIPRYYIAKGTETQKYHIYLEGGGWCSGITKQYGKGFNTCYQRRSTNMGSTLTSYDQDYLELTQAQTAFSLDSSLNPLMYNWNAVFVRYCDGTSFSGNLDNPINITMTNDDDDDGVNSSNIIPIYFRGFRILKAVFLDLLKNEGMNIATDIVIHGGSAGGLATWLHSDYIKTELILPNMLNNDYRNNVLISALPDSGYFLEYNGLFENNTMLHLTNYSNGMKYLFDISNSSFSGININCLNEYNNNNTNNEKNKCFFAANIAKYIEIDMFAINSQYDEWQADNILGTGTSNINALNEYGYNFTKLFFGHYINTANKSTGNHGGFEDSCYHHDFDWNNIYDANYSHAQAHAHWYKLKMIDKSNENIYWFQNYTYPCATCCKAPTSQMAPPP